MSIYDNMKDSGGNMIETLVIAGGVAGVTAVWFAVWNPARRM